MATEQTSRDSIVYEPRDSIEKQNESNYLTDEIKLFYEETLHNSNQLQ